MHVWSRQRVCSLGVVLSFVFALGATSGAAQEGTFEVEELDLSHPVRHAIFSLEDPDTSRPVLAVAGVDEEGVARLSLFPIDQKGGLSAKAGRILRLPRQVIALDAAGGTLYALMPDGVYRWNLDTARFSRVLESASIFQSRPSLKLVETSFLQDVDGDGDADVVLPGFAEVALALQDERGRFRRGTSLDVPAISYHQEYNRRITYRPISIYFLDGDGDGTRDAIAIQGGSMLFFAGLGPGRFAPARVVPLKLGITDRFLGDQVGDVGHEDQVWKRVVRVDDFDGNGAMDLFTHTIESKGLFDKKHRFDFHPGVSEAPFVQQSGDGQGIDTDVVIDEPLFADVNGDGRLDFGAWSVDLGVGTIFGWLVTGTVDLEVSYYALRPDGTYSDEPDRREVVEAGFDLSSGKPAVPPWFVADVNGDRRQDLVLGEGEDRLRVFLGDGSVQLFQREPVLTRVKLPGNGRDLVSPVDVNRDGKEDLVIRYGKIDGEGLDRKLRVLLAR